MATRKKAAKKAVPKVEEPKQIIMTVEQYENLVSVKQILDRATDDLRDLAKDSLADITPMNVGFQMGAIHKALLEGYEKASALQSDLDPDPIVYDWENDDEDNEEDNF